VLGVFISTHVFKPLRIIVLANAAEKFDCFEPLGFRFASGHHLHRFLVFAGWAVTNNEPEIVRAMKVCCRFVHTLAIGFIDCGVAVFWACLLLVALAIGVVECLDQLAVMSQQRRLRAA
jgi:hypothetical protein